MSSVAIRDFIRLQMRKAGLTETEDMKKVLESDDFNLELPDFIANPVSEKTYGFIQAINKPEIRNNILADRFDSIENGLKSLLSDNFGITSDKYEELRGDRNESNFQKFLSSLIPELKQLVQTGDDADKKPGNEKTGKQSEIIQQLENKIVELSRAHEQEIAELNSMHSGKMSTLKINNVVQREFSKYNLKESVNGLKSMVFKQVMEDVNKKAVLKYDDETGEVVPHNPDEPDLKLMNDKNEVLTLKSLLDEGMADFIAKSDPTKTKKPESKTTVPVPKKKTNRYVYGGNVVEKND